MPLEINEIGIRMRVGENNREPDERQPKIPQGDCQDINREELVDDCVRRVLQILKTLEGR
jgi:hypothetical protein